MTRVWNGDIRPAEMIPSAKVTTWYDSVIEGLDEDVAAWLSTVYLAAREKKLTVGGTVLVTVVNSLDYGEASVTLLQKIQTELDPERNTGEGYGLAPIGHVVRVESATPVPICVSTRITFEAGYGWNMLDSLIQEAVSDYLLELRKEWADSDTLVVRISRIEAKILAIQGVADIAGTTLNGMEENVVFGKYEIPVSGGVRAVLSGS